MKKSQFTIKKIENGYGIFIRKYQNTPEHQAHPLAVLPTKEAAKQRLSQYLRRVNGGAA
jgi:hypothetical protein